MTGKFLKKAKQTISILSVIAIVFAINIFAQTDENAVSPDQQALAAKEELIAKLKTSGKKPAEFTANLAELLNKYPYDEQGGNFVSSLNYYLRSETNPEVLRGLINQFVKDTAQLPAALKANVYQYSAAVLVNNKFYADAETLLQAVAASFNETEFVEFKKKQFDESQTPAAKQRRAKQTEETIRKNPKLAEFYREAEKTPPQFNSKRAQNDFKGLKLKTYDLLGKSLWEQGKHREAEAAYRNSYAIEPSKDSMLGIAKAAETNGNSAEALKYAVSAVLTGKAEISDMEYFRALYAKNNPGKIADAEKYLDAEYLKTYRNPAKGEKYQKTAQRTKRIVLAEFFTGAGCLPCIPFDYAFETVHQNYQTKDLALLVYHMHAPAPDPLGNFSADSRVKYYDLIGAPGTFIDGAKFKSDDGANGAAETDRNQKIYNALVRQINASLETAPEANLKLKVKRENQNFKVNVNTNKLQNVSDDVTLHIALVENEVSYSGENGMRFHVMVVRALAGDNDKKIFGLKVDPSQAGKFEYVFNLPEIVARNLSYYNSSSENGVMRFKFKKNEINPQHLSIAAFLQDNKTKKILQSAIIKLDK